MKALWTILLLTIATELYYACGTRECTMAGCFCTEPEIYFLIEKVKYGTNPIDFEIQDLDHFYLGQQNLSSDRIIDSIKVSFRIIEGRKSYYYFELNETTFGDRTDLRDYKYLIINRPINFLDSIIGVNYLYSDTTFLCNYCDPPPHEYTTCQWVKNFQCIYNDELKNLGGFGPPENSILIERQ